MHKLLNQFEIVFPILLITRKLRRDDNLERILEYVST